MERTDRLFNEISKRVAEGEASATLELALCVALLHRLLGPAEGEIAGSPLEAKPCERDPKMVEEAWTTYHSQPGPAIDAMARVLREAYRQRLDSASLEAAFVEAARAGLRFDRI